MKLRMLGGVFASLLTTQLVAAQETKSLGVSAGASTDGDSNASVDEKSSESAVTTTSADVDVAAESAPPSEVPAYAGARASRDPNPYEPSARFAQVPYMQRYKPTGNLWEVGLFAGALIPSSSHNIMVPGTTHEAYNDVSLTAGARLAYFPLSFIGVEAEGSVSPTATQTSNRSALLYSARGHVLLQLPLWSIVPFALAGGGVMGGISQPMGHDGDPLFHFGVGAKIPFNHLVSARIDLRDNLIQKHDASNGTPSHNFEILLGATFTFERTAPPAPIDSDYDGLFDSEDKCPNVGALTADGCDPDTDGDGVPDSIDECRTVAGEGPNGCPVVNPDEDGDGVPLPCDLCPEEKGVSPDGCPIRDKDGDGILDNVDKCPNEPETRNGFQDEDGCPDEVPEAVKRFTGVMRGIAFDQGKASIRRESHSTLDAAYDILAQHPSIRIEVSGHTSSEGAAEVNQRLSEERAESVRSYLISKGVEESRVIARGAGSSEPIADNATRDGREQNRRIEFRILAQP